VAGVQPNAFASDGLVDQARSYRIAGFGAIDRNGRVFVYDKRQAPVDSVSNDCLSRSAFQPDDHGCQPGHEIVAGLAGASDTCLGDSGGPLLVSPQGTSGSASGASFVLAGVTSRPTRSRSHPCGDGGIYERADADARRWIMAAMNAMRR
jgi:endonuclease G